MEYKTNIFTENLKSFVINEKNLRRKKKTSKLVQSLADFLPIKYKSELLGFGSEGENVVIKEGFRFSKGYNIYLGKKIYINRDCFMQDSDKILINNFTLIGPKVQIYTSTHEIYSRHRITYPVIVSERSWIGGGSIILPGVLIGENSIIGAGSVVNRDVDSNSIYAGNPARKVRDL